MRKNEDVILCIPIWQVLTMGNDFVSCALQVGLCTAKYFDVDISVLLDLSALWAARESNCKKCIIGCQDVYAKLLECQNAMHLTWIAFIQLI